MSMNMINYAVKKLSMGKEKSKLFNAIVTVDKETVLSSLSQAKRNQCCCQCCLTQQIELATKEATNWLANNIK
jgi:hypothetical protein